MGLGMTRSSQRKAADRAFSLYIRRRDGKCRICGDIANLQCAHLWSRRYHAIRFDPCNAIALCRGCHVRYTHNPALWTQWCEENVPEYWHLRTLALEGVTEDGVPSSKLDYLSIKRHFTQLAEVSDG